MTTSNADDKCVKECTNVINAAKEAIAARDAEIADQHQTILDLSNYLDITRSDLSKSNTALDAWYHNPIILGLLGAVVGGAGVLVLQKH